MTPYFSHTFSDIRVNAEQFEPMEDTDSRDIYAFGVMMYQMLTGLEAPFLIGVNTLEELNLALWNYKFMHDQSKYTWAIDYLRWN